MHETNMQTAYRTESYRDQWTGSGLAGYLLVALTVVTLAGLSVEVFGAVLATVTLAVGSM